MKLLTIEKSSVSEDGTIKYVQKTNDNGLFESVFMPIEKEYKFCISTQIGCSNKCMHCATGKSDYIRDLSAEEMFEQINEMVRVNDIDDRDMHVMFMGMGEPFFNFENVIKSIDYLKQKYSMDDHDFTVSTVGIIEKINKLTEMNRNIKLAVSIHSGIDEKRSRLLPINKLQPLESLIESIKKYNQVTNNEVIIQYTLIDGFNDSQEDMDALYEAIKDINGELQIIPLNETPQIIYKKPSEKKITFFYNGIKDLYPTVLKRSMGDDIQAGCGQLYTEI